MSANHIKNNKIYCVFQFGMFDFDIAQDFFDFDKNFFDIAFDTDFMAKSNIPN